MPGTNPKKEKKPTLQGKKKKPILIIGGLDKVDVEKKASGGRAGYRMGGKCKLAMKGKGKAYGKNS